MNTFTSYRHPARASDNETAAEGSPGGMAVGSGLFLLVIAAALTHFVFIGLLGFLMLPVVFGCLVVGLIRTRNLLAHPVLQAIGLLLMLAAAAFLIFGAIASVNLAHTAAMHEHLKSSKVPAPDAARWLTTMALWFLPAALWWLGLRMAAAWPSSSCWISCVAILLVSPAAMLLFRLLTKLFAITA